MATNFPTGLDSYVNPTGSDTLGEVSVLHSAQHSNINDAMEAVETKLGIDFSSVATSLDYITKMLLMTTLQHPSGGYREIVGGAFPTSITWYTDSGKTIKLVEKTYTYAGSIPILPTTITLRIYNGTSSNTLRRTITDTVTYDRVFETSRTRTVS